MMAHRPAIMMCRPAPGSRVHAILIAMNLADRLAELAERGASVEIRDGFGRHLGTLSADDLRTIVVATQEPTALLAPRRRLTMAEAEEFKARWLAAVAANPYPRLISPPPTVRWLHRPVGRSWWRRALSRLYR